MWKKLIISKVTVYGNNTDESVTTTKQLKFTLKKLKRGKSYYIKVQAYEVVNKKKLYGAFSNKIRTKKVK